MKTLEISTSARCELVDITDSVNALIPGNITHGVCHIYSPHTTAGLTVNENADPAVKHDLLTKLTKLIPQHEPYYAHDEGNSDAHLKASLMGFSLCLPICDGRLALGVWQGVYLCEFDGPRSRKVQLTFLPAQA